MAEAQGLEQPAAAPSSHDMVARRPVGRAAGLLPGDVVIAVNGAAVKSPSDLTREVAKARAGENLQPGRHPRRQAPHRGRPLGRPVRPSSELASTTLDRRGTRRGRARPGGRPRAAPECWACRWRRCDDAARRATGLNLPDVRGALRGPSVGPVVRRRPRSGPAPRRRHHPSANGRDGRPAPTDFAAVGRRRQEGRPRQNVLVGVYRNGRTALPADRRFPASSRAGARGRQCGS